MPFVQRVVSPTYVSRSRSRSSPMLMVAATGTRTTTGESELASDTRITSSITTTTTATTTKTITINIATSAAETNGVAKFIGSSSSSSKNNTGPSNGLCNGVKSYNSSKTSSINDFKANGVVVNHNTCGSGGETSTVLEHQKNNAIVSKRQQQCNKRDFSPIVSGYEFDSVSNITLSNALRQLASLVLIANDIFVELNRELQNVGDRSKAIKQRIQVLETNVLEFDPKLVTVPESDLETFVHIKNHFNCTKPFEKELFTPESRSFNLRKLYEAAAKAPISAFTGDRLDDDQIDGGSDEQRRKAAAERGDFDFLCTPVFGQIHRKMRTRVDVEIETRLPAAVEELRKWTSTEALGDITVTPDCISRVSLHNTSISMNNTTFTGNSCSQNIHNNSRSHHQQHNSRSLTAHNQPGVSTDVTDDNSTTVIVQPSNINNSINLRPPPSNEDADDLPLDHRLPSPEEQCQIIALKFPAEVVTVDTSGKRFQRMCLARKSLMHCPPTGIVIGDQNNLNDDIQTIKRRSRSRKPRGKRRNTIAGTDQKEIEEAANGEITSSASPRSGIVQNTAVVTSRSKSTDILKKDSPLSSDAGKPSTLTRFNSLKQWGRNRLRLINRNADDKKDKQQVLDIDNDSNVYETCISKNKKKFAEKERKLSHERKPSYSSSEKSLSTMTTSSTATAAGTVVTGNILNSITKIPSLKVASASINPVKLRESSTLRRERRNGLGNKDEPHSSSGNWSASSESGRTSIGSELTVQPKSSASSTSLNHSNIHSGSGPPSSVISRRKFLNTSASSSVTSEGTATPDLQIHDFHYDDETSSAYSCDTEGYYTSFHVDSGLKTLKEEEPMTPLHSTSALSSNNSFGSSINQVTLTAESEYELFGRGSTSTTTSSAGTVCTTLMVADDKSSMQGGPAVPERKSSLTKLNRSNSNTSSSTLERSYSSSTVGSTLERTGTIKRNGVLVQKEVSVIVHSEQPEPKTCTAVEAKTRAADACAIANINRIESPDSGNNTSSSPVQTNSNNDSPTQGVRSNSEFEYSECSDLEGVDRVERIRVKTTINSSRIPSMCIITPTTSDDENIKDIDLSQRHLNNREQLQLPTEAPQETDLDSILYRKEAVNKENNKVQIISVNQATGYATIQLVEPKSMQSQPQKHQQNVKKIAAPESNAPKKDANFNNFKRTTLQPLNSMLGKLKGVLPHLKKSPNKELSAHTFDEKLYDTAGEYVTIADVRNNNSNSALKRTMNNGIYYSNDIVRRNLATVLSGNLNQEYVSLNELPCSIRCDDGSSCDSVKRNILPIQREERDEIDTSKDLSYLRVVSDFDDNTGGDNTSSSSDNARTSKTVTATTKTYEEEASRGARVQFDAHGKIVYNSDSLKRRKGAHTTFAPGKCVKDAAIMANSTVQPATTTAAAVIESVNPYSVPNHLKDKGITKSPLLGRGGLLNRKQIVVRPVLSQKSLYQHPINHHNHNLMATSVISSNFASNDQQHLTSASPLSFHNDGIIESSSQFRTDEDYQHSPHKNPSLYSGPNMSSQISTSSTTLSRPPIPTTTFGGGNSKTSAIPVPSSFPRNNQIYWTLQHKKQPLIHGAPANPLIRDDSNTPMKNGKNLEVLYATPNKIRERNQLKTTPTGFATFFSPISKTNPEIPPVQSQQSINMSPIDPRTAASFRTSTPSKTLFSEGEWSSPPPISSLTDDLRHRLHLQERSRSANNSPGSSGRSTPLKGLVEQQQSRSRHSWAPDIAAEPANSTCSDRLGTPKTSLMDFKKLLLATSTKHMSTAAKMSAVELLKAKKESNPSSPPPAAAPSQNLLNTSMNILELSGSPKSFASRRMIRQGNFGSPSKSLGSSKSQRAGWRLNPIRTEVITTAIPEANSEEDTSSSSGSIERRSPNPINKVALSEMKVPTTNISPNISQQTSAVIEEKIDLKKNIFLQAEENNFMKGEAQLKTTTAGVVSSSNIGGDSDNDAVRAGLSRSQLIHARTQFLYGSNPLKPQSQNDIKFNSLRKPASTKLLTDNENIMGKSDTTVKNSPSPSKEAAALETAF